MKNFTEKYAKALPLVIVIPAVMIFMFIGSVTVTFGEDELMLAATLTSSVTVEYDDIESAEYRDGFSAGSRTLGIGNNKIAAGNFRNEEFGSYSLYVYNSTGVCIVIKTTERYIVFNCETAEETKSVYEILLTKIENQR